MSWRYLREVVAESSDLSCSDIESSAPLKTTNIVKRSCCNDNATVCLSHSRFGRTLSHLTGDHGAASWISLLRASRVNRFRERDQCEPPTTAKTDGQQQPESLARYCRESSTWKTSQISLLSNTLDEYSENWPRSGTISNGVVYRGKPLERLIPETDSGFMEKVPTPTATQLGGSRAWFKTLLSKEGGPPVKNSRVYDPKTGYHITINLSRFVKIWPRKNEARGDLNPSYVEWLMGWPIGWTDLEPLETGKYQQWLKKHINN